MGRHQAVVLTSPPVLVSLSTNCHSLAVAVATSRSGHRKRGAMSSSLLRATGHCVNTLLSGLIFDFLLIGGHLEFLVPTGVQCDKSDLHHPLLPYCRRVRSCSSLANVFAHWYTLRVTLLLTESRPHSHDHVMPSESVRPQGTAPARFQHWNHAVIKVVARRVGVLLAWAHQFLSESQPFYRRVRN